MKLRKLYPTILLSLVMAVCLTFSQIASVRAATEDAQTYYDAHKDVVAVIDDENENYFAKLLEQAKLNSAYVDVMRNVVEVAEAYVEYSTGYGEVDYFASDWAEMVKKINLTHNYVKLTADNYLAYDYTKYMTRIAADTLTLNKYVTKQQAYDSEKQKAADDVADKEQTLFKVNNANAAGPAEKFVGYYDSDGVAEIAAIKTAFDNNLAALTLDKADYDGSVAAVKELAAKAKADMDAVRKNVLERAYDQLKDYYAIVSGDKAGDAAAQKEATAQAIAGTDGFIKNASDEVKKEYSAQIKAFEDFFDENDIDRSEYENKSVLETTDGAIKVTAVDADGNPLKVFPAHSTLKAYNVVRTSPKRYNALKEINKDNGNISIAYFIDIEVYSSTEIWEAATQFEGKAVKYVVEVKLDDYYTNYIVGNASLVTKTLKDAGLTGDDTTNKTEQITQCADYLKANEGSLCYSYYKDGEEGAVKSLKYSLSGGTLMFETNSFGAVAVTENSKASIASSPLFWVLLILGIALIIVVVVLIFRFMKYKVVFYSNGGSDVAPVKARKGESYVMPENPTREGFIFAGWYEDEELTERFVATKMAKRKQLKAYAKWAEIIAVPEEVEEAAPAAPAAVAAAQGADEAKLAEYYNEVRKTALGYALANENEKAKEGMTLVRAYKLSDGVYVYLALDAEAEGLEKAEGALAEETPAMFKVCDDESMAKAKQLVDKAMTEYGLELTGKEVGELKEGISKGFAYRLKYQKED